MFEKNINEFLGAKEPEKSFVKQQEWLMKYIEDGIKGEPEISEINNKCLVEHRRIIQERLEGAV